MDDKEEGFKKEGELGKLSIAPIPSFRRGQGKAGSESEKGIRTDFLDDKDNHQDKKKHGKDNPGDAKGIDKGIRKQSDIHILRKE